MNKLLGWPQALVDAGVTVRLLDGWDQPQLSHGDPYLWREPDGNAAGMMHHHVASSSYKPNRVKANGYPGLSHDGSERLYQEDYGDGHFEPVFTIANAYPAPISSGAGDISVLERVRENVEVVGRQGPDTPNWYGNTHYINIEWVLDGVGARIDQRVWDMMVSVCQVTNDLMTDSNVLWTPNRHVGHGHHTGRKPDLDDGRFLSFDETIQQLRKDMEVKSHYIIGEEDQDFEALLWRMAWIDGLVIDNDGNSAQIVSVFPWHQGVSVRIPMLEDFEKFGLLTGKSRAKIDAMIADGLYKKGLEVAGLDQLMYR